MQWPGIFYGHLMILPLVGCLTLSLFLLFQCREALVGRDNTGILKDGKYVMSASILHDSNP
jgi:hypothetical protein